MSRVVYLMTNGEGMSGGRLNHNIAAHPFLGEAETAPKYRFYSVRDEFPGIFHVGTEDGGTVRGELYDVPLEVIRDAFLPDEPPELELGVVELADGRGTLCMTLRASVRQAGDGLVDITEHGGWRAYRSTLG